MGKKANWIKLHRNIAIYDACGFSQEEVKQRFNLKKNTGITIDEGVVVPLSVYINEEASRLLIELLKFCTPRYVPIFTNLFGVMTEKQFDKDKSVDRKYQSVVGNIKKDKYSLLQKVDLLTHTLGVTRKALEICFNEDIPLHLAEMIVLLALTHDFGKNEEIKKFYVSAEENSPHEKISAVFLASFLKEHNKGIEQELLVTDEEIEILYKTLLLHHTSDAVETYFIKYLNMADKLTREDEIKREGLK